MENRLVLWYLFLFHLIKNIFFIIHREIENIEFIFRIRIFLWYTESPYSAFFFFWKFFRIRDIFSMNDSTKMGRSENSFFFLFRYVGCTATSTQYARRVFFCRTLEGGCRKLSHHHTDPSLTRTPYIGYMENIVARMHKVDEWWQSRNGDFTYTGI